MAQKPKFVERKVANLVTRRDYAKQFVKFEEPDLLEIQKKSYDRFLKKELGDLIASYFPINHIKNKTHHVEINTKTGINGLLFYPGAFDEQEARYKGKTYETSVYVDLILVNDETGEVKKVKKTKNDKHDGVFFANIPLMTDNGTFIINGVEKLVNSQTIRSPGAYILSKSQIKLSGKKKVNEGYICELYPNRGTMLNFVIDDKKTDKRIIKLVARNATSDAAVTLSATQFLKGLGLNQDTILDIYSHAEIIVNSLAADGEAKSYSNKFAGCYTHDTIGQDDEIKKIRKAVCDCPTVNDIKQAGLPIQRKLQVLVWKWSKLEDQLTEVNKQLEADSTNKSLKEKQIDLTKKIRDQKDLLITEKAAKDMITTLAISIRPTEVLSQKFAGFCYQDYLVKHFMEVKGFDLSSAGRNKINHKMRVTERLYQKVLADDILYKNGKVFLKKDTLINKKEIDMIKAGISSGELFLEKEWELTSSSRFHRYKTAKAEVIKVYADNDEWDDYVNILGVPPTSDVDTLNISDIIAMISYTINLPWNIGNYDDIDHLGNKRLRLIHEQFKSKLVAGMARVEKHIKDKLSSLSSPTMNAEEKAKKSKTASIKSIVNTKPFQQVVKAFFNTYQLTAFIDQTNPLSELTNKRRISAMGDGGIRKDDPNLNVRDVHYSHYGRICPIETPEGQNIGLIMALASFAKVDENGFLISPYFVVENGVITEKIRWLNASQEDEYIIGESLIPHDENGKITQPKVVGRYRGMQELYDAKQINYIDVSPRQVISIAASAIPFLENDDTARALMGSNMQRQAVPLLKPYAPIVGTGAEYKIAHDSGLNILAAHAGEVAAMDGNEITVLTNLEAKHKLQKGDVHIFTIDNDTKKPEWDTTNGIMYAFRHGRLTENQAEWIGSKTDKRAFKFRIEYKLSYLPDGLEFPRGTMKRDGEEYVVTVERMNATTAEQEYLNQWKPLIWANKILYQEDKGVYEWTRLIKYRKTNQNTCNNQFPIVEVGQKIKESQVIADGPAMFNGELAIGRNPIIAYTTWHGYNFEDAIVISKRLVQDDWYTSISVIEKELRCTRTKNGDEEITRDIPNVSDDFKKYLNEDGIILEGAEVKEGDILVGKVSPKGESDDSGEEKLLRTIFGKISNVRDSSLKVKVGEEGTVIAVKRFKSSDGEKFDDETIELVKVYIAQKRKLQIGDKMSGRHGNKGTISRIVPVEDMPHMEDGTPIDILLSPLGVPSRMNIGQILEVHLGWAMRNIAKKKLWELMQEEATPDKFVQLFGMSSYRAKQLKKVCSKYFKDNKISKFDQFSNVDLTIILNRAGMSIEDLSYKASTPVFAGAKLDDVADALKEAGIDPIKTRGKMKLIDGQTGEYFDGDITVGIMYMLKLDHMVEDKIHARAVGPYSKVNQQPLGGRSQDGGQRFGEMEVWALEAYGATYNLREILTIKSDDTVGRNLTYNSIIKGLPLPKPSLPESFKLLTKQLQGLCLSMTVTDQKGVKHDMDDFSKANIDAELDPEKEVSQHADETTTVQEVDDSEYGSL